MTDLLKMTYTDIKTELISVNKQIGLYRLKLEKLEKQGKNNTFEYEHTMLRIFGFECVSDELTKILREKALKGELDS